MNYQETIYEAAKKAFDELHQKEKQEQEWWFQLDQDEEAIEEFTRCQ